MSRTKKGGKSGACPGCPFCAPKMSQYTVNKAKARRKTKKEVKDATEDSQGR